MALVGVALITHHLDMLAPFLSFIKMLKCYEPAEKNGNPSKPLINWYWILLITKFNNLSLSPVKGT